MRQAGRRFGYRGMLVAFGLAAVTLLAASGTGSAGTRVIRFKGDGPKVLPHIRITTPSTLRWTNSGSSFQILDSGGACLEGAVASQTRSGSSYLPAGLYQELSVAAIGDWTITIRPGVEQVPTPISFSGSGERALPPFVLRNAKTMYWTNTGAIFQIYPADRPTAGVVSTEETHGSTHLPPGRYRFFVNASAAEEPDGHWQIVIR